MNAYIDSNAVEIKQTPDATGCRFYSAKEKE